jgi:hypothetical protein
MSGRRKVLFGLAGAGFALSYPAFAQSAFSIRPISPNNQLESDFLAAFENEAMRPAFRARLLESQVALALAPGENAGPLQVATANGVQSGAIFTSAARLESVLGAEAPRIELTGREALTRLRANHVAINYRLIPMLTLEPADVENFLRIPT